MHSLRLQKVKSEPGRKGVRLLAHLNSDFAKGRLFIHLAKVAQRAWESKEISVPERVRQQVASDETYDDNREYRGHHAAAARRSRPPREHSGVFEQMQAPSKHDK